MVNKTNEKFDDIKFDLSFQEQVNQLREIKGFGENDEIVNVNGLLTKDELIRIHKRMIANKDGTMLFIKNVLECIPLKTPISELDYIIILFYIFYDKWITYEELLELPISYVPIVGEKYSNEEFSLHMKRYKTFLNTNQFSELILTARRYLDIKTGNTIGNISSISARYYLYLNKYDEYLGLYDSFLHGVLKILDEFDELHYMNILDLLHILNYVKTNSSINAEELKDPLSTIVINSYPGSYFIENSDYDKRAIYFEFPIFTDTDYIKKMNGKIISDVIEHYKLLRGKVRISNTKNKYRNKRIGEIYREYKKKHRGVDIALKKTEEKFKELFPETKLDDGKRTAEQVIVSIINS
jgi:hypothetical protein